MSVTDTSQNETLEVGPENLKMSFSSTSGQLKRMTNYRTRVKDLDVELESTKQKSKQNLQQAILIERERVTQMQWDMEELRRKYLEMESKLKFEQDERIHSELVKVSAIHEELLVQELDVAKEQLNNLQKHQEELEMKSKADIKLLIKEVKHAGLESFRRGLSKVKFLKW
ncbi:PX domain-containing protein EREL1-like [Magnolia sinica]|uniref:PX domain-containing protein EREL1-like n=1 Tax=Magnolia sinica TaxID=86752 RepID=UPI00265B112A|nr:PX domain-containing protein EREL1-like [Magnolia sinica]